MRRAIGPLVIAVTLLLVLVAAMHLAPGAIAQDATPDPAQRMEIAPGVAIEIGGLDGPGSFHLYLDPGAVFPIDPGGGLELLYVESGHVNVQLDGTVTVGALGMTDDAGEVVPADTDVTLTAGQYIVLEPQLTGELRNEGETTVSIAVADLTPSMQDIATPAG